VIDIAYFLAGIKTALWTLVFVQSIGLVILLCQLFRRR
jgi:hypothetical protein